MNVLIVHLSKGKSYETIKINKTGEILDFI